MQIESPEDAKKFIQCSELQKLLKFYPELNFDSVLEETPEIAEFLR